MNNWFFFHRILLTPLSKLFHPDEPTYICRYPLVRKEIDVRVVHVEDYNRVFVSLLEDESKIDKLNDNMFKYYENNGEFFFIALKKLFRMIIDEFLISNYTSRDTYSMSVSCAIIPQPGQTPFVAIPSRMPTYGPVASSY